MIKKLEKHLNKDSYPRDDLVTQATAIKQAVAFDDSHELVAAHLLIAQSVAVAPLLELAQRLAQIRFAVTDGRFAEWHFRQLSVKTENEQKRKRTEDENIESSQCILAKRISQS